MDGCDQTSGKEEEQVIPGEGAYQIASAAPHNRGAQHPGRSRAPSGRWSWSRPAVHQGHPPACTAPSQTARQGTATARARIRRGSSRYSQRTNRPAKVKFQVRQGWSGSGRLRQGRLRQGRLGRTLMPRRIENTPQCDGIGPAKLGSDCSRPATSQILGRHNHTVENRITARQQKWYAPKHTLVGRN